MKGKLLLTIVLTLFLTSCEKDDATDHSGAEVKFTAGFIPLSSSSPSSPNTRLTTNNNWAGLSDRTIAIEIDGVVKSYVVDESGNLTSADPFYWGNKTELKVNAWYPYNGGTKPETPVVKADQRGSGYWESDHLEVVTLSVSPEKPNLSFRHRTTQLLCDLNKTTGISDNGVKVRFLNLAGVESGNTVQATADCRALVVPQAIPAGTEFMEITLKDNRTFTYTLEEDLSLEQDHSMGIEIEASEKGIKVTFTDSTTWNGNSDDVNGNTSTVNPGAGDADWSGNTDDVIGGIPSIKPGNENSPTWNGEEVSVDGEKQTINKE